MDISSLLASLAARHLPDYDAARGLLRLRMRTNPHCAPFQELPDLFATRESLYFAHLLLHRHRGAPDPRALRILEEVVAAQCADGGERDGLWHYYADLDVNAWPAPDPNWADFNAMALLLILHTDGARLPSALREKVVASVHRAARFVMRRNVAVGYTNIALKGAFVTFAAGELTGDAALLAYARERVEKIRRKIVADGRIAEYLSPTYAGVSLAALAAFDALVGDAAARAAMREVQHIFWRHILGRFHAPSGLLAGPHSRAYDAGLGSARSTLGLLLAKLAGERPLRLESRKAEEPLSAIMGAVLAPDAPAEALADALNPERRADLIDPAYVENDGLLVTYTTHLEPAFCLGSVNRHDGWGQRQNIVAYWPVAGGDFGRLGYRTLNDGHALAAGIVHAAQAGGRVLAGVTLAPGRDAHPYITVSSLTSAQLGGEIFWEQPDGRMRVRVEGREAATRAELELDLAPGALVELATETHTVHLRLLALVSPSASAAPMPRLSWDGTRGRLWMPWHEGAAREFSWDQLAGSRLAFTVGITSDPAAPEPAPAEQALPADGEWRLAWAGLALALPRVSPVFR
ncbi:MAG: hypothetical protein H7Y06_00010 [Opitutaceae bacterium]|nr:hypothetical protein [Opitutaceae bacterium]